MISLQALVNLGHSVIVIEHQPDIIKCADYIIDIGPKQVNMVVKLYLQELLKN